MSKSYAKAKGRSKANKLPPFVAMTWVLLNSKAYKELRPSAGKALPYFIGKVKKPVGDLHHHQTNFSLSYSEAIQLGFAKGTFSKIINELVGKGFIDPIKKGGLRGFGKTTSIFRLSKRWENYGKADFEKTEWCSFI